jgi:hypothetical protein
MTRKQKLQKTFDYRAIKKGSIVQPCSRYRASTPYSDSTALDDAPYRGRPVLVRSLSFAFMENSKVHKCGWKVCSEKRSRLNAKFIGYVQLPVFLTSSFCLRFVQAGHQFNHRPQIFIPRARMGLKLNQPPL